MDLPLQARYRKLKSAGSLPIILRLPSILYVTILVVLSSMTYHRVPRNFPQLSLQRAASPRCRFDIPYNVPPRVHMATMMQSHNRLLYSPLRSACSDGLGHAFGIMNAEVGAALRLGLAYSHRKATYGSLTQSNPDAVELFFAWGEGVPREVVREQLCESDWRGSGSKCQICKRVRGNATDVVKRIVQIPENLTYKRIECGKTRDCQGALSTFLETYNEANTLFQMPVKFCDRSPLDSIIDPKARAYFFHKYWDRHGSSTISASGISLTEGSVKSRQKMGREQMPAAQRTVPAKRSAVRFDGKSVVFAVHARRGDFFVENRPMVSAEAFGFAIRQVMLVIQKHGGFFAMLPVAVHVYSEGRAKKGVKTPGHNIDMMVADFVDADGKIRGAAFIEHVIRNGTSATSAYDEFSGGSHSADTGILFANGLKVHMHIAEDTLTCLHEMISADVFIGSDSALSKFIVTSLSRGAVQIMPSSSLRFGTECCALPFAHRSGLILSKDRLRAQWAAYASNWDKVTSHQP